MNELSPEDIAHQQELLRIYRHTLAVYEQQEALHGRAYVPPFIVHGIQEAREHIAGIKKRLWHWGIAVPHNPSDTSSTSPSGVLNSDRYTILSTASKGGRAMVYMARDNMLRRNVFLKVAHQITKRQDFLREAQIAVKLNHPSIIRWHDLVQDSDGTVYGVQEYIRGSSLEQLKRKTLLKPSLIIKILIQVAEALHYGHCNGVLHLDLNLGNILVDAQGKAYVLDFGILNPEPGSIIGRRHYMAPETLLGVSDFKDPRTDIWNLGSIMYELLTGEHPFFNEGSLGANLQQLLRIPPQRPTILNNRVPQQLEIICLKCLSFERGDRYDTAALLATDLRQVLR
jgi:eukaryotic-like serine/threonine-protein kinase